MNNHNWGRALNRFFVVIAVVFLLVMIIYPVYSAIQTEHRLRDREIDIAMGTKDDVATRLTEVGKINRAHERNIYDIWVYSFSLRNLMYRVVLSAVILGAAYLICFGAFHLIRWLAAG
jgi:hypothetical protein